MAGWAEGGERVNLGSGIGGLVIPLIAEDTYREHIVGDWWDELTLCELGQRVARRFRHPDTPERYAHAFPPELRFPVVEQGTLV